jgi:hypothetical protein
VLLTVLLGDGGPLDESETLASLGVDDDPSLWDLWDAAREEFGERTLGAVDGTEVLTPTMTMNEAAAALAELLALDGRDPAPMSSPREAAGG